MFGSPLAVAEALLSTQANSLADFVNRSLDEFTASGLLEPDGNSSSDGIDPCSKLLIAFLDQPEAFANNFAGVGIFASLDLGLDQSIVMIGKGDISRRHSSDPHVAQENILNSV